MSSDPVSSPAAAPSAEVSESSSVYVLDPPSLVVYTLDRQSIETLRDLLALSESDIRAMQGVGRKKRRIFRDLQARARDLLRHQHPNLAVVSSAAGSVARETAERLDEQGVDLTAPWQEVLRLLPKRASDGLAAVGAVTLSDVLRLTYETRHLLDLPNFGRGSLREIKQQIGRIAEEGLDGYLYGGPCPSSPAETVESILKSFSHHERQIVCERFIHHRTLEEMGKARGYTRERARQRIRETVSKARVRFGAVAGPLLSDVMETAERSGGISSEQVIESALGLTLGEACLLLHVAGHEDWKIWQESFLLKGKVDDFKSRLLPLYEQLTEVPAVVVPWDSVSRLARETAGLDLPRPTLIRLCRAEFGFDYDPYGLLVPQTIADRLAGILSETGRAMCIDELVAAYYDRFEPVAATSAYESKEERDKLFHRFRAHANRHPEIWTLERGVYVHEAHLPFDLQAVEKLIPAARRVLEEEGDAMQAEVLMARVGADRIAGLTPTAFKQSLCPDPEILPLRGADRVVHRRNTDEGSLYLKDRVEEILAKAGKPLTHDEVQGGLPSELNYHWLSVQIVLSHETWSLNVGRGRYVHARNLGLEPEQLRSLLDAAVSLLPEDGLPTSLSRLARQAAAEAGLRPKSVDAPVGYRGILHAHLRRDGRVVLESSGLVARADATQDGRLLEQAVARTVRRLEEASPSEIRAYLAEELGYDGHPNALYMTLDRLVGRGLLVRRRQGRYRPREAAA